MEEKKSTFYASYFNKDIVLKLSRWAGVLARVILAVYVVTWLFSLLQYFLQFETGIFYQKGISILDMLVYFTPYLLQPIPGVVYFFGLKFVEHALLIFMDTEESARRAARTVK